MKTLRKRIERFCGRTDVKKWSLTLSKEWMAAHPDEVRKLIRKIYRTNADIKPDYENKKLIIYLHKLNHWKDDKIAQILCDELNKTKTEFPGTDLVINYRCDSMTEVCEGLRVGQ